MQKIPQSIIVNEITGWANNCQPIELRIGSKADLSDSSIWVTNKQADFLNKPIFRTTESEPIPENPSNEFQSFLRATENSHRLAFPLDEMGLSLECDERKPAAFDSCSQPIIHSFQSHLVDFFVNRSDLFIEINFSDRIVNNIERTR